MKPHLYINSNGFFVTRHSYSGSESFRSCARRYYLERVQGWSEREERSSRHFGTALEHAITFWHQRGFDTAGAVAEFIKLWEEHKDPEPTEENPNPKPRYSYSKTDLDWDRLNLTGQELVKLYAIKYPTLPYVVKNPKDSFQVQTGFEVFPGTDLAGIEFTGYIDLVAERKDRQDPIIIDMKTSGKDVPDMTVLDPQLRSYAWAKGWPDVAFLWFRKMGRTISKGDTVTFLEARDSFKPGDSATVLVNDEFGLWVTDDDTVLEAFNLMKGTSKAVEAARQKFVEEKASFVSESAITKQRVQFKDAQITADSAADMGRRIKRDIVSIVAANQANDWSMDSGVRFPHEQCTSCCMRGICSGNSDLRDALVVRKQQDELDFGNDSE
jgi:hypothetical protein